MQKPEPASIPLTPGVYLYKDARGRVIYVGKARVLRRRVLSYFRAEGLPAKTRAMLAHAERLDFLSTTTEKEALLLEASLIKKHRPHYNIVLRDDKQYALFRLNIRHEFPRLEIVRSARRDGARYFGPFTSAMAARETWKLIHRAFGLRRCSDRAMRNRVRPCLYHHMGQCPAPCMGLVSAHDYQVSVQRVCDLLAGRATPLLDTLRAEMTAAADALEFERAASLRDQVRAVERTVERQAAIIPAGGDMDAVGVAGAENGLALGIVFVRSGAVTDGRAFFWPGLGFEDAPELLWSFLGQFYSSAAPPPRILLPWIPPDAEDGASDAEAAPNAEENAPENGADQTEQTAAPAHGSRSVLEQALAERRGGPVRVLAPRNAADNQLVDMATANAREEARRRRGQGEEALLARVGAALRLPGPPRRIECVDVSHTGGRQTRVGLVVYVDGRPGREEYRVYSMPDSGDDYATLHAWVARRLESGPPWPDLLLIDGGKGQLAAVERAFREAAALPPGREGTAAGLHNACADDACVDHAALEWVRQGGPALAAIAKARDEAGHADRRAGNVADRIFVPGRSNPLSLREGSQELLFLQQIRDATHRFAIGRHRRARTGAALSGELMRLPGIGPATARLLWDHFGSVEAMARASEAELRALPGVGKARAASLRERLRRLA